VIKVQGPRSQLPAPRSRSGLDNKIAVLLLEIDVNSFKAETTYLQARAGAPQQQLSQASANGR
jgi:hypothetical protein